MDLTGMTFGRLTVLYRNAVDYVRPKSKKHSARWDCLCECGNNVTVVQSQLLNSHTQSCGCLQRERAAQAHTKHGFRFERLHNIWSNMKNRCYNKNYIEFENYGGKGITVCPEWHDYIPFREWALANGYNPDAPRGECTLDRIDVNKGYSPDNCRFADMMTQGNNKTYNVYYDFNGQKLTISQIARELGVSYNYLYYRLRLKCMPLQDIIDHCV